MRIPLPRRRPSPQATVTPPTAHRARSRSRSTARPRSSPTPAAATSTSWHWDLDNDGTFDDASTACHVTTGTSPRRATTRSSSRSRARAASRDTTDRQRRRRQRAAGPRRSTAPACNARRLLDRRRHDHLQRAPRPTRRTGDRRRRPSSTGTLIIEHCPAGCHATSTSSRSVTGVVAARSRRRTTSTRPTSDQAHRHRQQGRRRHRRSSSCSPRRRPSTWRRPRAACRSRSAPRSRPAPWTATVIKGGDGDARARPLTRTISGKRYRFSTWNDSHTRVRERSTVDGGQDPHGHLRPGRAGQLLHGDGVGQGRLASRSARAATTDVDWFEFHIANEAEGRHPGHRSADQPEGRALQGLLDAARQRQRARAGTTT